MLAFQLLYVSAVRAQKRWRIQEIIGDLISTGTMEKAAAITYKAECTVS
jgi:hypothetical protein